MLRRILDEARQLLLQEEHRLLGELRVVLVRLDASVEVQKALARSIAQLDELFLLVVVGEFNSGKSAVINALLGERVLEEGVTPTTSRIGLLRHGREAGRAPAGGGFEVITRPLPILSEITIVDTPGTNAVVRDHEALTREFVPRSDLVLFVTSADRPFTESERAFLEMIRSWGKKVVLALNKIDILEAPGDVAAVVDFVKEKVLGLLGFKPQVFAVSARQARRAREERNEALRGASGMDALESFVTRTLHESVRVRLKLLNPLEVALHVVEQAEQIVKERLALLKEDFALLEELEGQLRLHREDLARNLRYRLAEVEKVLFELERRGGDFLDRTLRVLRLVGLLDAGRTRGAFEGEVVADLPRVVERRVDEIGDWMAASEAGHWQGIAERVQRRQAVHADRMGEAKGAFAYEPSPSLKELRREVQRVVEGYDHRTAARRLAETARGAAVTTILLEAAAVGLAAGGLALSAAPTAQVTALLAAVALSGVGLLLLPALRKRARTALGAEMAGMRETLVSRLKASLDREPEQGQKRALEALGPYSRFVRAEGERLRGQGQELAAIRDGLKGLKARVESL
jgi:small GTP-binding protein